MQTLHFTPSYCEITERSLTCCPAGTCNTWLAGSPSVPAGHAWLSEVFQYDRRLELCNSRFDNFWQELIILECLTSTELLEISFEWTRMVGENTDMI